MTDWTQMDPGEFGADGPGVLFDASTLARCPDKYGTPDLFGAAQPGPGQYSDNYVNQLACGHEYDTPEPVPAGQAVTCSAHGPTTVTRPDPAANPRWWEAAIAGTCSHGGHGWDGDTCDDAPAQATDETGSQETSDEETSENCPRCGAINWGQTPDGRLECARCLWSEPDNGHAAAGS